jgi:hypothetical protein
MQPTNLNLKAIALGARAYCAAIDGIARR